MPSETASVRERTPSFSSTAARWYLTVCVVMQVRGDFFVAEPAGDEPQHLELASGKRGAPLRDRAWRSRPNHALANYHVGVLGNPDQRDLPVSPEQRSHTATHHGVGEIEVDAQLH